jgi:hypothetical protein
MLEFALRDAWIALRERPALLQEVVDELLSDPIYLKNLGRCGGLHNFDARELSRKFSQQTDESPLDAA